MKINWIEIKSKKGLSIKKIKFNKLNLLVGESGVGKSQILSFIKFMKVLTKDNEKNFDNLIQYDCQYNINFNIGENNYIYKVKINLNTDKNNLCEFEIENEELYVNGKNIIYRDGDFSYIEGYSKLPLIKKNDTLANIFSEEDILKNIFDSAINIYDLTNMTNLEFDASKLIINKINKISCSIDELSNRKYQKVGMAGYHGSYKVVAEVLYHFNIDGFNQVKQDFKEIFYNVEDIIVKYNYEKEIDELFLKEKNCDKWINWAQVSSGMKKVFSFLVILKSIPGGSIVLIDEFENGLGNNCIDELTEYILNYEKDIQFIITSHHPYIINNIPTKFWSVITRKNSVVKNINAKGIGIGSTKYDAFFELVNFLENEGDKN